MICVFFLFRMCNICFVHHTAAHGEWTDNRIFRKLIFFLPNTWQILPEIGRIAEFS